ncbi:hypothetical protein HGG82_11165 [Marinomonas sp. M1K-6]|uniref:Uncharacterized protein n=1 Tax=Marinomonas profundi TaxID=2726122 RepID=A0A847RAF8_9GAMM|nr:AhpA/YtjB family protein [Marinomonas profundi]NLQ18177.1 hypothetical protein [Marinomonas profundi]UDV03533.1 hypothetical protein J8N69_01725 [Marinomonas profundi]
MDTQPKTKATLAFLRKRLSASVITVTTFISLMVFTVCIFWYTMTSALDNYLSQQTEVLGSSLATQAAFNATQSILNNDLLSLNVLLNRLVVDDNILSARVYNKKDELLAEADSSMAGITEQNFRPTDKRSVYSSSIKFRDEIVGHVLITLDKTPAQATLQHLNRLLIGVAIFTSTISLLLIILVTRWLFAPINTTTNALLTLSKGHKTTTFPEPIYTEGKALYHAFQAAQKPQPAKEVASKTPQTETDAVTSMNVAKAQFEMNFDAIFEESRQRSCVLYFDIINTEEWHESMTPLQFSNLLTPVYRALFQASELYLGQVHQYNNNSAVILFSAAHCDDNLYINAVSTAQLFLGLMEKLLESELYTSVPVLNFHLGLHQGNPQITHMIQDNRFAPEEIQPLLQDIQLLSQSKSLNKLVISDDIFTLSYIQNRVFSGLPEIIEENGEEVLAYEVKGMSDKYKQQIQQHIMDIVNSK